MEDANSPKDLFGLFRDLIALHGQNASNLHDRIREISDDDSDSGSLMSTVHRTIMDIRSLFGGLDTSIIPGLIDGEQRNIKSYDHALTECESNESIRAALVEACVKLIGAD